MTKFLIILAALIALFGCAEEPSTPNFRVEGFTADEVELIQQAIDQWCEVSNGKYCEVIDPNASNVIKFNPNWSKAHLGLTTLDGATNTIEIYNNRDYEDWKKVVYAVALHELGHHYRHNVKHLLPMGNDVMACGTLTRTLTADDINAEYTYDCD